MASFLQVPVTRLAEDVLQALLEEYASRDGTDYGEQEQTLDKKVDSLRAQLDGGRLVILYESDGEHWDLIPVEQAAVLLDP